MSPTLDEITSARRPGPTLQSMGPAGLAWAAWPCPGRPALCRPPGLPPEAFRREVARKRSSSSERSTSGGAAPIRDDLCQEASSSLPFHSLPASPDFDHQILSLDHVHGITILAQNSTIRSHGQLHPFCSIQVNPEPKFKLQTSDHRANPYGRHPRVAAWPAGHHQGRPA